MLALALGHANTEVIIAGTEVVAIVLVIAGSLACVCAVRGAASPKWLGAVALRVTCAESEGAVAAAETVDEGSAVRARETVPPSNAVPV